MIVIEVWVHFDSQAKLIVCKVSMTTTDFNSSAFQLTTLLDVEETLDNRFEADGLIGDEENAISIDCGKQDDVVE